MFQSKEGMAEELLGVMGAHRKYEIVLGRMIARLGTNRLDKEVLEAASGTIDEMVTTTVKIYCEHIDKKTMRGLLKFYKSRIGYKFMVATQKIDSDLISLATEWNKEVLDITNRLLLKDAAERGINARDYIPPLEI